MRRASWVLGMVFAGASSAPAVDLLIPPPSETIRIEAGELTRIPLSTPLRTGEIVWVLPYTLINETDQKRDITISFLMTTDARRIIELPVSEQPEGPEVLASRHRFVPFQVYAFDRPEARQKMGSLLGVEFLSQVRMQGAIRPGERKTGVAVFSGVPMDVHFLDVHVFGLCPVLRLSVKKGQQGFSQTETSGETLKKFLKMGIPIVRIVSGASEVGESPVDESFLSLVKELKARDYEALAKDEAVRGDLFERESRYFRCADPIFASADGDILRQRWVLRLSYERILETARGTADYTEQIGRNWIMGLSEEKKVVSD